MYMPALDRSLSLSDCRLDSSLDCPLGMLESYAVDIDNKCCENDPDQCFWSDGGSPAECDIECGVALLGPGTHCDKTIDLALDGMDGSLDGASHVIDGLRT